MNEDNSNNNRNNHENDPSPKECIRQKCLMCKEFKPGGKFACTDFSCPLWLYMSDDEEAGEDWLEQVEIYKSICRKLYKRVTAVGPDLRTQV